MAKEEKKQLSLFMLILIEYLVAVVLTVIMLFYQRNFEKLGIINGMQVSGALLFIAGWFAFINHEGLFDVLVYGVKSFFKGIVGKKMEKELFEIRLARKPIPKRIFLSLWINGVIIVFISFLIYYLF